MSTTKISVSIDDAELAWLKRRARHAHGGNLSAAMTEAARLLRRHEALRAFLKSERVPQLSPKEIADRMGVSVKTVGSYDARIKEKLGCSDSGELMREAVLWHDRQRGV